MAKAYFNGALERVSGRSGNLVFRQQHGQNVIARFPSNLEPQAPSPAQQQQRDKFKQAHEYAQKVMKDPLQLRVYRQIARERKRPTNALLIHDFCTPPEIELIELANYAGRPGGQIKVLASDDIEVVSVTLAVRDTNGVAIEEGPVARIHGVWVYTATRELPPGLFTIDVAATDRPGNQATRAEVYRQN